MMPWLALGFGWFLLGAVPVPCLGADPSEGWATYFTKDFYHMSILPLMVATAVLAFLARPSTSDEFPFGFRQFQLRYLVVWALCVAADWLQGPYVYALYAAYGFDSREIAQLFVAGFGASLVFGSFVGTFADKCGRKACCIAYCLLYIASCMTKHFNLYWILMIGRITGGIATSMLFSCFECWMVSEHLQRHEFSGGLLGYMFGLMFTIMYLVAIGSGLAGQLVADTWKFAPIAEGSAIYTGGYLCPFDLAIGCLIIGGILITAMWDENYGHQGNVGDTTSALADNIKEGVKMVFFDRRALLLGVIVSAFEGSMFAFVFNWTPALDSKVVSPPHGVIFALFMMACMCGASTATLASNLMKPTARLLATFASGCMSFVIAAHAASRQHGENLERSLLAFLIFEFCVGVYFPSVGVLKSEVVPDGLRGTVYNLYRMPLNGIVVGLLLSNIQMETCFKVNAVLLLISVVSMWFIHTAAPGDADTPSTAANDMEANIEMACNGYDEVPQKESPSPVTIGKRHVGSTRPNDDSTV